MFTAPDPLGLQHDLRKAVLDLQPRWLRGIATNVPNLDANVRKVRPDVALHPSVLARFGARPVLPDGEMKPYRPASIRDHDTVKQYYS